jgi:hypothetical protein
MIGDIGTKSDFYFVLPFGGGITFLALLAVMILLLPVAAIVYRRNRSQEPVLRLGLCAALGFMGPLSWYVLGFSHSVIHGFATVVLLYFPWGILGTLFAVKSAALGLGTIKGMLKRVQPGRMRVMLGP